MDQQNMTALICSFSRAYHSRVNTVKIYNDFLAEKMITEDEFNQISENMAKGINFFNPEFRGSESEALRWIVDNQLSPSPLGRAAYAETLLRRAIDEGVTQYIILGSGYDSFSYSEYEWANDLMIFELDKPSILNDKQNRYKRIGMNAPKNTEFIPVDFTEKEWLNGLIKNASFNPKKDCFISLLGVSYYLSRDDFEQLLKGISQMTHGKVFIVFDYPDENTYTSNAGERAKKQVMLAKASGAEMLACYSIDEINAILTDHGYKTIEQLTPGDITNRVFSAYNKSNPKHIITAFDNVNYCLGVKL